MNTGQPDPSRRVNRRRRPGGFTLMELVVAMFITTVLAVGMGSVMLIAMHATPAARSPMTRTLDATRVADQIAAELHSAVTVIQTLPTSVEFTVDRGGVSHTIRYAWSSTPGDPLTRQYDGGAVLAVLNAVEAFTLDYTAKSVASSQPPPDVEGPEVLFVQQDSGNSGTASEFVIQTNVKGAEYFVPSLPADAVSWRITRATFMASPDGTASGILAVDIYTRQGSGKPGSKVDGVLVAESDLVANSWHEVAFANGGGLDPTAGYFLHFSRQSGGGATAKITKGTGSLGSPETVYWFDGGGGTWWSDTTQDIWMWVWGTVTTPDPDWEPPDTTVLSRVNISLNTGTGGSTRVEAATAVLNQPGFTP